MQGLQLMRKLH